MRARPFEIQLHTPHIISLKHEISIRAEVLLVLNYNKKVQQYLLPTFFYILDEYYTLQTLSTIIRTSNTFGVCHMLLQSQLLVQSAQHVLVHFLKW